MNREYVLIQENRDGSSHYFVRVALGLFWECTIHPREARRFRSRPAASKVLTTNGKHQQGWRVIPAPERIPI